MRIIQSLFTTCTRNWQVSSCTFLFSVILLSLSSCTEEPSALGFNKDIDRIGIFYKEFDIPVTTVQADSLRTDNVRINIDVPVDVNLDRLMAGTSSDPYFGEIQTRFFTEFMPPTIGGRIKKQNVVLTKATMTLLLDYYFYGDTTQVATQTFQVRKVGRRGMDRDQVFFSGSDLTLDDPVLSTAEFVFHPDSIQKSIRLNTDNNKNNNRLDSLYFELDNAFGQRLLDSVLNLPDTLDDLSVQEFQRAFRGVGVEPVNTSIVMGFDAGNYTSRITLYYNYVENSTPKRGKYVFVFGSPYCQSFTRIDRNRSNTNLSGVNSKYTPVNVSDGYSYIQAGTGLYARLDLSEFHTYFDTIANPMINSAELIIPTPTSVERNHPNKPKDLYFMFLGDNNRFYRPVYYQPNSNGTPIEKVDPNFATAYYAEIGEEFVTYARGDDSYGLKLPYVINTEGTFYRSFMSEWFQNQLSLPIIYPPVKKIGLVPSDAPFGKSLNGISFKADQVKLRVFYSKALIKN